MNNRIPITVLAGYLGSGKTTIINDILSRPYGARLAVVVNDFGQINIDAKLIQSQGTQAIELSNGCICCSIGDDLGATLDKIAAWSQPPDHVLLEASGIAEPTRIAAIAGNWPGYQLNSLIVAADATTIQDRACDKFVRTLILSQLRSADVIALTKTDLLGLDEKETIRAWLSDVAPGIGVMKVVRGAVALDLMLGGPVRSPLKLLEKRPLPCFASASWRIEEPVDAGKLRECLMALPAEIHRVKGVVTDASSGTRFLIQYAGGRLSMVPTAVDVLPCLVLISVGTQNSLDKLCSQLKKRCSL